MSSGSSIAGIAMAVALSVGWVSSLAAQVPGDPYRAVRDVVDGTGGPISGLGAAFLQRRPAWRLSLEGLGAGAWETESGSGTIRVVGSGGARVAGTFIRLGTPSTDLRFLELRAILGADVSLDGTLVDLTQYACAILDHGHHVGDEFGNPFEDGLTSATRCAENQWAAARIRAMTFVFRPSEGATSAELARFGFVVAPMQTGRTIHARSEAITFETAVSFDWADRVGEGFLRAHLLGHAVVSTTDRRARLEFRVEGSTLTRFGGPHALTVEAELRGTVFWFVPHEGVSSVFLALRLGTTTDPTLGAVSLYDGWVRQDSVSLALGLIAYPYRGVFELPEEDE